MSNCLLIKVPSAVTDDSLRKLGEYVLRVIPKGDLSGMTRVRIQITGSGSNPLPIVRLTNGKIYETEAGVALDELQLKTSADNKNTFFIKVLENKTGYLKIENASRIYRLGYAYAEIFAEKINVANSPTTEVIIDGSAKVLTGMINGFFVSDFSETIESIVNFKNSTLFVADQSINLKGDIGGIKSGILRTLSIKGTIVEGDIYSLFKNCPSLANFECSTYGTVVSFKGDGSTALNSATMSKIFYTNTLPNVDGNRQFGNFIKSLSKCTFGTGSTVTIRGDQYTLASDEQTALDLLRTKTTVTINS